MGTPRVTGRLPRVIKPETVEIGDVISYQEPETRGRRVTFQGMIGYRQDINGVRTYFTGEGAALMEWAPGRKMGVCTLLRAAEQPQTPLSIFEAAGLDDSERYD